MFDWVQAVSPMRPGVRRLSCQSTHVTSHQLPWSRPAVRETFHNPKTTALGQWSYHNHYVIGSWAAAIRKNGPSQNPGPVWRVSSSEYHCQRAMRTKFSLGGSERVLELKARRNQTWTPKIDQTLQLQYWGLAAPQGQGGLSHGLTWP